MRDVAEYQTKSVEFDALASRATDEALKKRYADLAECYRLLASERQRLIDEGAPVQGTALVNAVVHAALKKGGPRLQEGTRGPE